MQVWIWMCRGLPVLCKGWPCVRLVLQSLLCQPRSDSVVQQGTGSTETGPFLLLMCMILWPRLKLGEQGP